MNKKSRMWIQLTCKYKHGSADESSHVIFLDTSCFYHHQTSTYSVLSSLLYDDDGRFENVQKRKEINSLSSAKDQMPKVTNFPNI